jgi:hypothetical protein
MSDDGLKLNLNARTMDRLLWFLIWAPIALCLLISVSTLGLSEFWTAFTGISLKWVALLPAVAVIHEALHAVGLWMAGAGRNSVWFSFDKTKFSIGCHCSDAISLNGFRVAALLPFMILTPLLLGVALLAGHAGAWALLVISLSACAYDLTIAIAMVGTQGSTKVIPQLYSNDGFVFLKLAAT